MPVFKPAFSSLMSKLLDIHSKICYNKRSVTLFLNTFTCIKFSDYEYTVSTMPS